MKFKSIVLCCLALLYGNSLLAFKITYKSDTDQKIDIKVDVDGKTKGLKRSSGVGSYDAPHWKNVKPGKDEAWNIDTIKKEFGNNAKKVGITIFYTKKDDIWTPAAAYRRPVSSCPGVPLHPSVHSQSTGVAGSALAMCRAGPGHPQPSPSR